MSAKNRIRKGRDLKRQKPKKPPYETVLIVCEGQKTECNYFRGLRQKYRLNTAHIKIESGGKGSAPINVVNYAMDYAEKEPGIDRVFCVFDRDEHESFQEAIDKIQSHKPKPRAKSKPVYRAIVSSPCFEFWVLLHYTYTTKTHNQNSKSSCDCLIKDLRTQFPGYEKSDENLFETLWPKTATAIQNAKKVKKANESNDSTSPDTDIHELVEYIINLKK